MKRVIKSSFGYRDEDWVDPDPEMTEADDRGVTINLPEFEITTMEDGYVEEIPEHMFSKEDLEDELDGIQVTDVESVEEAIFDELDKMNLSGNTTYKINGYVDVLYHVWVPTEYAHMRARYSHRYEDHDATPDFDIDEIDCYLTAVEKGL